MTAISASPRLTTYAPVTPETAFPVNFPIFDNSDLLVLVNGEQVSFTVSSSYSDGISTDAVVNVSPGVTGAVQIIGLRSTRRTDQYEDGRPLPIVNHNYSLNRLTAELQEVRRDIGRAAKVGYGSDGPRLEKLTEGHFWLADPAGDMIDGGSAADIARAQGYAAEALASSLEAGVSAAAAAARLADMMAATPTIYFDTIGALRLFSTVTFAGLAFVRGYWTVGDAGGGYFRRDFADTSTADDFGYTIVDALGRRWKRVRPDNSHWAEHFGARGNDAVNDGPGIRRAMAKIVPSVGGEVRLAGGNYLIAGEAGADSFKNGILIPWSGDFTRTRQIRLVGMGMTQLTCTTSDTILLRVSDTNAYVGNIRFYQGTGVRNNWGVAFVPESMEQTTTQVSQSDGVLDRVSIWGFKEGLFFRPGPTVGGSGSGCFNHRLYDVQIQSCVRSVGTDFAVNDANNYPTRISMYGGRVERTMCAFDWRAVESFQLYGVNTQFTNRTQSFWPLETDFPVADGKPRVFWIGPGTKLCRVFGGADEAGQTTWWVWRETTDTNDSALTLINRPAVALSVDGEIGGVPTSSGQFPRCAMYNYDRIQVAPLSNASPLAVRFRHRMGALELDGNPSILFYTNTTYRGGIYSTGLIIGASATPSSTVPGNLFGSVDGSVSRSFTGIDTSRIHQQYGNTTGITGTIVTNGTATAYNTSSDEYLKERLSRTTADEAVSILKAIDVWDILWRADGSADITTIAQELHAVWPRAVTVGGWEIDPEGDPVYVPWQVDLTKLLPVVIRAGQAAHERIDAAQAERDAALTRLADVESRLAAIEAAIARGGMLQ